MKGKTTAPDLFASPDKPELPKVELSKPVEVAKQPEKKKEVVVFVRSTDSARGLHNFKNEAERKEAFPNGPTSLKQLKEKMKIKNQNNYNELH